MDMKCFKTQNVFLDATVQKSEGRGIREGQWQSCSGITDVCSGPESLCAIPGNRKMEEEQAMRAGHTGGHHEHDMQSQHSQCSVQDPQTNQTACWGVLEMGPTRPTGCVVIRQGQACRNTVGRRAVRRSHLGQCHYFLAKGRRKWSEYHHTPAQALGISGAWTQVIWAKEKVSTSLSTTGEMFGYWEMWAGQGGSPSFSPTREISCRVQHGDSTRSRCACQAADSNFFENLNSAKS